MEGRSNTGRRPTRGAQPGERGATSASCVEPTSVTSRASYWACGAVWAWRTWLTTEAVATVRGAPLRRGPRPSRLPVGQAPDTSRRQSPHPPRVPLTQRPARELRAGVRDGPGREHQPAPPGPAPPRKTAGARTRPSLQPHDPIPPLCSYSLSEDIFFFSLF